MLSTIDIVHSEYTFCARTLTPSLLLEEVEGWASLKTCKRLCAPASQAELEQSFSAIFCIQSCNIIFQSERGVLKVVRGSGIECKNVDYKREQRSKNNTVSRSTLFTICLCSVLPFLQTWKKIEMNIDRNFQKQY